jgi:hypothetical protein
VEFKYVVGKSNVVADAQSRRPDLQLQTCAIQVRKRTRQGSYLEADEEEFDCVDAKSEVAPDLADIGNESVGAQPGSPKGATSLRPCLTQSVLPIVRKSSSPTRICRDLSSYRRVYGSKGAQTGAPGWSSQMMLSSM